MNSTPVVPVSPSEQSYSNKPKAPPPLHTASPVTAWGGANDKHDKNNQNGAATGSTVEVLDLAGEPTSVDSGPHIEKHVNHETAEPKRHSLFEFSDSEAIKKEVRATLLRPAAYSVFDFYYKDGIWQFLAKHPLFENVTLGVIAFNAVWIAVDTDWNKEEAFTKAHALFQIVEHMFCAYFSMEWFVRFMAFQHKCNGLKDGWFVFDSLLVIMMVGETWVFTILGEISGNKGQSPLGGAAVLRLFRLLRLSRLLRMLRSLPELMILIKGMITAMKSVLYVMCLLVIILYVFAIAFTQLAVDTAVIRDAYFQNVALSMYSLLIYGTFLDDLSKFADDIRYDSIPCLVLLLVFICLSALTVMNMLIGVLCEVVSAVASTEKEMILTATVAEKMKDIVTSLDTNSNGMISFVEFRRILEIPEALRALEDVGVDPAGVVDFAELMFFEDSDPNRPVELPFDTFMEMILDLRCSNTATVKDIKYMWRQINPKMAHLTKDIGELGERTIRMEKTMDSVLTEVQKLVSRTEGTQRGIGAPIYQFSNPGTVNDGQH